PSSRRSPGSPPAKRRSRLSSRRACAAWSTRSRTSTTCKTSIRRRCSTEDPRHRPGPAHHRLRRDREERPGPALHHQRLRQIGQWRSRHAVEGPARRAARGDRAAWSAGGRGREGFRERESTVHAAPGPGARHGNLRRRDRGPAGVGVHRAAGEAVGRRQRPRSEGAGAAHGATAARAAGRAFAGRGRRACLRHLPRAWRAIGAPRDARPAHAQGQADLIGRLTGRLAAKHPPQVLVDVGGVAYELDVPMSTFYALPANGETVSLLTHLVVREDAHNLYGFATLEERSAFRQLIRISGIGARTALAVLSGMSV